MATPESIMRTGRAAQIAQSNAASRQLISAYRDVWSDIHGQLARLQQQIATAQATGEPVRISWLYQQQRLQQMQQQVGDALTRFTGHAQQMTVDAIQQSMRTGAADADTALRAMLDDMSLPPGIQIAFNRVNFGALEDAAQNAFTYRASGESGRTLASLYTSLTPDMQQRARRTIISAVATGQAPAVTARALKQQMGIGLNRALTIARTEQMNAYRRANIATYAANSDVCDGWEWLAAADACDFCQSMNGTKHPVTEQMDSHPRCRCVASPIAKPLSDILAAFAA